MLLLLPPLVLLLPSAATDSFMPLRLQADGVAAPTAKPGCALGGDFYRGVDEPLSACLAHCEAEPECGGFSFKLSAGVGEPSSAGTDGGGNCTGAVGTLCCYMQHPAAITGVDPRANFSCFEKPLKPGNATFTVGGERTTFPHFWETGINSPHSAMTLRSDYQKQMTALHEDIGYKYTRIHAPFARDYSLAQGPNNTVSYYNAFVTYDFLLSIGMKPWIELGYTPCWMSGPAAVPLNSYWPTVDYGLCVGSPETMEDWTGLIDHYVGTMIERYGLEEVESWVWVLFNEPGGVNAYSKEWETGGFSYYEMFFNTSRAIKKHSQKITFGGLSDSPEQAAILMNLTRAVPERENAFDIFTYHRYCNGQTPATCAASQISTVASLREVLPPGMPIYLEETGSSAGCYVPFHDTTGEAAFVVPYVAAMHAANLSGAHWWCASDLYTEHGCPPDIAGGKGFTWIPHENYSGGMPRSEFTGRWGFTTPSGIPKPIHRAFSLLHEAGTERLQVKEDPGGSCRNNTAVLALANSTDDSANDGGSGMMVFVSNSGKANCSVTLRGLPTTLTSKGVDNVATAMLHKIDSTHGNPYGLFQSMGSPSFPTPAQTAKLLAASALTPEPIQLLRSTPTTSSGERGDEGSRGVQGQEVVLELEPNALQVLVL